MRHLVPLLLGAYALAAPVTPGRSARLDDPRAYDGAWRVGAQGRDELVNLCKQIGRYIACQQTRNGKTLGLSVFVGSKKPGRYYTQEVTLEGMPGSRSELEIDGNRWVYSGKGRERGRTVYYQTTNIFAGADHIHYERAKSGDGIHWTVIATGEEVRVTQVTNR